jgi:hypothetical protein
MSTLEAVVETDAAEAPSGGPVRAGTNRLLRASPHIVVWALLVIPALRNAIRGWRPLGDDGAIAIGAWRTLTLHPPLVGQLTFATSSQGNNDPGPLEYWILGPFAHLDPGQGVLIGSAILCAFILSVAIEILWRRAGMWAAVIFSVAVADLAILSPTPFVDPVWNSSFGFFWFIAFVGIAFVVGSGNLQYFALLIFIGSVAVDSHLIYLPSVGILLVFSLVCGWLMKRPKGLRWLWWTIGVAIVCWFAPIYQEFFEARPNLSALLRSMGLLSGGKVQKKEGLSYGLHALGRAASVSPIWASPRPLDPFASANDLAHGNIVLAFLVLLLMAGIVVMGVRRKERALVSMGVVSIGGSLGVVVLMASSPVSYLLSFIWVNLVVWIVGIFLWITVGYAAVIVLRPQIAKLQAQVAEVRAQAGAMGPTATRTRTATTATTRRTGLLLFMAAAGLAGTLIGVFPYGDQFIQDWPGVARVKQMTADVVNHVPKGNVGIGIIHNGGNTLQAASDEHGLAYLLMTKGWVPGMQPSINQLLGLPIHPKSPFVVFTEVGTRLTSARYYPVYQEFWFVTKK